MHARSEAHGEARLKFESVRDLLVESDPELKCTILPDRCSVLMFNVIV